MTKYLLFCFQEANFQTRSMLVPYDSIMRCPERVRDLEVLRKYATRDVPMGDWIVDQLLVNHITFRGDCGTADPSPYLKIVSELMYYADGMFEDDCYLQPYDQVWAKDIKIDVASKGFNHVANYCRFRKRTSYRKKEIEIVEGFLVLEQRHE